MSDYDADDPIVDPFDCGIMPDDYIPTPVDVERAIAKTIRDLRIGVAQMSAAREKGNEARREFLTVTAKMKKSVRADLRENGVTRFTEKEVDEELALTDKWKDAAVEHDLAVSELDDARDYQRMLEKRLDGLRTLASNLRSQT